MFSYRRILRLLSGSAIPAAILIIYLILVFALGGASRQNGFSWFVLTLGGFFCLGTAIASPGLRDLPKEATSPLIIFFATLFISMLQLVPLPNWLWHALPSNAAAVELESLLAIPKASRPASLTPDATLISLFWFVPPLAVFLLAIRMPWKRLSEMGRWLIPALSAVAVLLGFVQLVEGGGSIFYLYERTNRSAPVGTFSNINHQASFLLMCLPFVAASAGRFRQQKMSLREGDSAGFALFGFSLIILVGIATSGTVAVYLMAPAVLAMCGLIVFGRSNAVLDGRLIAAGGLLLGIAILSVYATPISKGLWSGDTDDRLYAIDVTVKAISRSMPTGTGLGSFVSVFPLFEDPYTTGNAFWNHAHNDYLEFILEYGVMGVFILVAVLMWYFRAVISLWTGKSLQGDGLRIKRAATVALGVCLVHSLVDYPLRTALVSCLAAFCVAIIICPVTRKSRASISKAPDTDHVEL